MGKALVVSLNSYPDTRLISVSSYWALKLIHAYLAVTAMILGSDVIDCEDVLGFSHLCASVRMEEQNKSAVAEENM